MKTCPKCGTEHSNKVTVCPHCNTTLEKQSANKFAIIIPVAVVYLIVMTFAILTLTDVICINHDWVAASCTEARVCKTCGKSDGNSLGHTWQEATCLAPKTCSVCNETEGEALPHTLNSWRTVKEPTLIATGTEERSCNTCGTTVESRTLAIKTPAVFGDAFNFTGEEFIEWISGIVSVDFDSELTTEGRENITYPISYKNGEEGAVVMNCEASSIDGNVHGIIVYFDKTTTAINLATHLATQIDPNFEKDAATLKLLSATPYKTNDITMMMYEMEGMMTVIFGPAEFLKLSAFMD